MRRQGVDGAVVIAVAVARTVISSVITKKATRTCKTGADGVVAIAVAV